MLSTFEVSYQNGTRHLLRTADFWDDDEKLEYVKGLVSCLPLLISRSLLSGLTNVYKGETD